MTDVTIKTVHTITVPLYPPPPPEQNSYGAPIEQNIVLSTETARILLDKLLKLFP